MIMASINALIDGLGNFIGWILASTIGTVATAVAWVIRQTIRNKDGIDENERSISDLEDETEISNNPTRLESHEERMERQQNDIAELKGYFTGDSNDPNNPGLLSEVHDIKQHLDDDE